MNIGTMGKHLYRPEVGSNDDMVACSFKKCGISFFSTVPKMERPTDKHQRIRIAKS